MWTWFVSLFSKIGNLLKRFAQTQSARIAQGLADIAAEAIQEFAACEWTNAQKREAALERIKDRAIQEGKEFTETAALAALQMVYAILKEKVK